MVSDQGTHGCLKQTLFLPSWGLTDIRLGDNQGGPCVMGASGGGGGVAVGGFLEGITPERRYSRQRPQPSKGPRGGTELGSEGWGGASVSKTCVPGGPGKCCDEHSSTRCHQGAPSDNGSHLFTSSLGLWSGFLLRAQSDGTPRECQVPGHAKGHSLPAYNLGK